MVARFRPAIPASRRRQTRQPRPQLIRVNMFIPVPHEHLPVSSVCCTGAALSRTFPLLCDRDGKPRLRGCCPRMDMDPNSGNMLVLVITSAGAPASQACKKQQSRVGSI